MELAEIIPKAGQVRTLYCDNCGASMDLAFAAFAESVSGVRMEIANLPQLECLACNKSYLTDGAIVAIIELHRKAVAIHRLLTHAGVGALFVTLGPGEVA